ncbi:MAG: metallophosphoesterase [Proteobacteria bacterium]|nr:metallophosphoesterase [Pseudomonadota bacterium]
MKILLISDKISPILYDYFDRERFEDIDLVVSCGDLPADYMDYLVSMLNIPCYFVPGNHDEGFVDNPPQGWISLDGKLVEHKGITIMGLGGSRRYKNGPQQYSEAEMIWRYLKMKPKIWWKKGRIDILVTHAPAYKLNDLEDTPHKGFKVFRTIIETYNPKYFLHGHVHLSYSQNPRLITHGETTIINGFQHHIFEY